MRNTISWKQNPSDDFRFLTRRPDVFGAILVAVLLSGLAPAFLGGLSLLVAFCFKLSFRFEPVRDIVALSMSSSNEQFVCSSGNVIFSYYAVIFCNNELDGFRLSLCL
jgi:hypothetical protein